MPVFLFEDIIFGPVKSRRLGVSLGVNLLPLDIKFCNFDCIYCECGRTHKEKFSKNSFHSAKTVKKELEKKLIKMKNAGEALDVITFAGNGEPTMHPEFRKIIKNTIEIRDENFPEADIAVLSNATLINKKSVFEALSKVDYNILKLDSAFEDTVSLFNNPTQNYSIEKTVRNLKKFNGNLIIQTMFVKGIYNGIEIDNTSDREILAWTNLLKEIKPKKIMIYTIERDTPDPGLKKVSLEKLEKIAEKLKTEGFTVQISG